jgi:Zn-dependent protease with chaperone function
MSFLLMVFLTLVCLYEGYPEPRFGLTPGGGSLLTWLGVAALGLEAWWIARRLSRPLTRDPTLRDRLLHRYEWARFYHQLILVGCYLLALFVFGWGWVVWKGELPEGDNSPHGAELLLLAPFLTAQLLSWAFFYDADRALNRAAHPFVDLEPRGRAWLEPERGSLAAGPPLGGRVAYVAFQFRQKLALALIPVLLLIAQKETCRLFPWIEQHLTKIGLVAVVGLFVAMPWIVRLVWALKPLPDGPLRQRLLATARRLHFRCSNVLMWNTRSSMANAMVIGIVPWARYVVFTDRLVEDFSEDEVEAVFGHEVGHIKYHHMLYYLGFLLASIFVLGILAGDLHKWAGEVVPAWFPRTDRGDNGPGAMVSLAAALLAYVFVVFGFLSRRCERQADIFGCRAVSCRRPDCLGHLPDQPLPARGQGLCATGIRTFIRALEKVALVNGISRDRPGFLQSWQHSTIARRVDFLQRVLADPSLESRFQLRVALVKWALFVALGGTLLLLLGTHNWSL